MANDNVKTMVDSLADGDNIAAQDAFKSALSDKIGSALDDKRMTVANDWLNAGDNFEAIDTESELSGSSSAQDDFDAVAAKVDADSEVDFEIYESSINEISLFIVLFFSDFPFSDFTSNPLILESIIYIVILALFGTAIAKVMYIKLLAISTPVFSVSTTYLMPVVAIFWGLLDGEEFKLTQFIGTSIILIGVYLVTKKKAPIKGASN